LPAAVAVDGCRFPAASAVARRLRRTPNTTNPAAVPTLAPDRASPRRQPAARAANRRAWNLRLGAPGALTSNTQRAMIMANPTVPKTTCYDEGHYDASIEEVWRFKFFQIANFIRDQGVELPHDWAAHFSDLGFVRQLGCCIADAAERDFAKAAK